MGNVRTPQRRKQDVLLSPSINHLPPNRLSPLISSPLLPADQPVSQVGFGYSFEHMAVHRPEVVGGNEAELVADKEMTNPSAFQLASDVEVQQSVQTAHRVASSAPALQRFSVSASHPVPPPINRQADTKRPGWSLERMAITRDHLPPVQCKASGVSRAPESSPQREVLQQEPVESATSKENTTDGKTDQTDEGKAIQRFARSTHSNRVIQMQREWTGRNLEHYKEEQGVFYVQRNNSWETVSLSVEECVSQYFGAMVREEAPPTSIADFVGRHVKTFDPSQHPLFQGIVGVWDSSLARTGHAMGSGAADKRKNQYGDGIYVVNPGGDARDYQGLYLPSIVYGVYAMKNVEFHTKSDHMQTVYLDPQQFSLMCFVKESELPSVTEEQKARPKYEAPAPGTVRFNEEGKRDYSIF